MDQANLIEQQEVAPILNLFKELSQNTYYSYPSSLEYAKIHIQSFFLIPGTRMEECPCCRKKIKIQTYNRFSKNMYDLLSDEYGVTIPLYFTFLKFITAVQIFLFVIYGIFYLIVMRRFCRKSTKENIENICQFQGGMYSFIDLDNFLEYVRQNDAEYKYYQAVTFISFLLILFMPFLFEIIIRYRQYQKWDKEPINFSHENRTSVYVRFSNKELTAMQIQQALVKLILSDENQIIRDQVGLFMQPSCIQEVTHVYDYHGIMSQQQDRESYLLQILKLYHQKDNTAKEKIQKLKVCHEALLLYETKIPYAHKIVVRFDSVDQQKVCLMHFRRTLWDKVYTIYQILKRRLKDRRDFIRSESQSTLPSATNEIEIENNQVRVKGIFHAKEIYWQNLGLTVLSRLRYRIHSILTIVLTIVILMGGYSAIQYYKLGNKAAKRNGYQISKGEQILVIFFTIFVAFLSTYSTLTVLKNTVRSKRSSFTEQEMSTVRYIIFLHYGVINLIPYILILEIWDGDRDVVAFYDLIQLYQTRFIIKYVFHTFHLRHTAYFIRRYKVLKNFNPFNYFQGQLNELLTPPYFPVRGRLNLLFYNLTAGFILIYVCPIILVFCIVLNIYIYYFDKYVIADQYRVDPRYNIDHLSTMIKTYQFFLLPFNIYLFMRLYWNFGWLTTAGVPISAVVVLLLVFKRKKIVNTLILAIFSLKKDKTQHQNVGYASYKESRDQFYQNLRIGALTQIIDQVIQ